MITTTIATISSSPTLAKTTVTIIVTERELSKGEKVSKTSKQKSIQVPPHPSLF